MTKNFNPVELIIERYYEFYSFLLTPLISHLPILGFVIDASMIRLINIAL